MIRLAITSGLVAALAAYLLFWPTGMEPVAWTAPPLPAQGPSQLLLQDLPTIGADIGAAPAALDVDATGHIYEGLRDGRIVLVSQSLATWVELADTGGRPLGLARDAAGALLVAEGDKGLLQLERKRSYALTTAGSKPIGLAYGVAATPGASKAYVTDATVKFGGGQWPRDILEHGANGRVIEYDTGTHDGHVLVSGLHFPTGIAVAPDGAFLLIAESSEYRVLRYWLSGDKAGTREVFAENLPGFPAQLTLGASGRIWVGFLAGRSPVLDRLLMGNIFLRNVLGRVAPVAALRSTAGLVLGFDSDGHTIARLEGHGGDAYSSVNTVCEQGPWLYFGSTRERGVGRLPLNRVIPGAPPPPPGTDVLRPLRQRTISREKDEDEERRERH